MVNRRCMRACDQHFIFSKVTSVAARQNRLAKPRESCFLDSSGRTSHTYTGRNLLWAQCLPKTGKQIDNSRCANGFFGKQRKISLFFFLLLAFYLSLLLITFQLQHCLCCSELCVCVCVWRWPHNRIHQTGRRNMTMWPGCDALWSLPLTPTLTHCAHVH